MNLFHFLSPNKKQLIINSANREAGCQEPGLTNKGWESSNKKKIYKTVYYDYKAKAGLTKTDRVKQNTLITLLINSKRKSLGSLKLSYCFAVKIQPDQIHRAPPV